MDKKYQDIMMQNSRKTGIRGELRRGGVSSLSGAGHPRSGFSLVELLVVVGIISLLLATLLPALAGAKRQARSMVCKAQLRNIAVAWQAYLFDNDDCFYQGRNANHNFGGWLGKGGYGSSRPLNRYMGLPSVLEQQEGAEQFWCPADGGGILGQQPEERAFEYFGNSYQTNFFLIGPDRIGLPAGLYQAFHTQINRRLPRLKATRVDDPSHLLLAGDNNWLAQWHPFIPESILPENRDWHGKPGHYNMVFLDGRVDQVKIKKGVYVDQKNYRILPFSELDRMAYAVQAKSVKVMN